MTSPGPNTLERVTRVRDQHQEEILRRWSGVVSTGISRERMNEPGNQHPDDDYIIVVGVEKQSDLPDEPLVLDGVPVRFKVTGKLRTLGGAMDEPSR